MYYYLNGNFINHLLKEQMLLKSNWQIIVSQQGMIFDTQLPSYFSLLRIQGAKLAALIR